MFFRRLGSALVAVVAGGIVVLALSGHYGWFGLGAPPPGPFGATLVADGTAGGERWAVVAIRTADGEALHLRHRGVDVKQAALDRQVRVVGPSGYEAAVVMLPGTGRSMMFGLLPAGAVRAETAEGPVDVRTSGAGPYVIAPVSARPGTAVALEVFDSRSRPLRP